MLSGISFYKNVHMIIQYKTKQFPVSLQDTVPPCSTPLKWQLGSLLDPNLWSNDIKFLIEMLNEWKHLCRIDLLSCYNSWRNNPLLPFGKLQLTVEGFQVPIKAAN